MKIKEGKKYLCICDVVMDANQELAFTKGDIYDSESDGNLTNNTKDEGHGITNEFAEKHFIDIEDVGLKEACGIETEPEFVITKRQATEIYSFCKMHDEEFAEEVKDLFPSAFEKEFKTGYYKHINGTHPKWFWYCNFETFENYGCNSLGEWVYDSEDIHFYIRKYCEPMSELEFFEALKSEAVKRYKVGDYITSMLNNKTIKICDDEFELAEEFEYNSYQNKLYFHGFIVFDKGVFASLIPTITKEQAEKELNKKIIW